MRAPATPSSQPRGSARGPASVVGFGVPSKLAEHARDSTTRKINQSMFADIDKPGALAQPHAELLALVPRDLVKLPTSGDGMVLLEAGSTFHQLLARVLLTAPIDSARLAALSVVRASPFLSVLLGGQPVIATVLRVLETRLAAEDPAVAELVSERTAADHALSVVRGDLSTATTAAYRAAFGKAPDATRALSAS